MKLAILVIYMSVVIVMWRNVKLVQPLKAVFCASVPEFLVIIVVVNVWLVDSLIPSPMDAHRETDGTRGQGIVAFFISTPLALVASVGWYALRRMADPVLKKTPIEWSWR
jgi:hypothetical protein